MSDPETHEPVTFETSLRGTRHPVPSLMLYYVLISIAAGPAAVVLLPLRFFRYRTLRYDFDEDGMTARWGILFRREVSLAYSRIQDMHLVSNVLERWLGLGRIEIQTASGQSAAELTIEGLPDFEPIRDQLYARMRGARGARDQAAGSPHVDSPGTVGQPVVTDDRAIVALQAAVDEMRAIRHLLTRPQA
jgi:membrane protein YdbS with pleckstrin-like domain